MNWLAHLYLSERNPCFLVGNLLPDLLSIGELAALPAEFQGGVRQHRRIDAFTDRHPVVRRSIGRFDNSLRRFGGILTDVFYDHILAREWESHSATPLPQFAVEVYASFDRVRPYIAQEAFERLDAMRTDDWLCGYRDLAGITRALEGISSRFRRPVDLVPAVGVLERDYDAFRADFAAFFPELRAEVAGLSAA